MQSTNILQVKISGITCDACLKLVSKRLGAIDGVNNIKVKNKDGDTQIIAERQISINELQDALSDTDYSIIK